MDSIAYPTNVNITKGEIEVQWFEANISGRIAPTGYFVGIELNKEYLYGLAAGTGGLGQGFVCTDIFSIYSICENDLIVSRWDLLYTNMDPIPPTTVLTDCLINGMNFTAAGVWQFNEDGTKIISYDMSLPTLSAFTARIWSPECSVYNVSRTAEDIINGICLLEDTYCTNVDNQYASIQDCVTYLNQKEFGDVQKTMYDTVYCRALHSAMVHITPKTHCNHIGPQSKSCIARNYSDWYRWHDVNYDTNDHGNKDHAKPQSVYHAMIIMNIVLALILKQ